MNRTIYPTLSTPRIFFKKLTPVAFITTLIIVCSLSLPAVAECSSDSFLELPITKHNGSNWNYEIDTSLHIGSTLTSFLIEAPQILSSPYKCTGDDPIIRYESGFPYSGNNIFQTGIPGIGMKITAAPAGHLPTRRPAQYDPIENQYYKESQFTFVVTLIKTGYIPSGGQIFGPPFMQSFIENHGNAPYITSSLTRPLNIILKRPTCAVTTPNFTVNLGDISITDFNADGRTKPKNFNIDLDCTGGTNSADIYVTLTDANNPGNSSSQLNLSPDSGAQGIALEVNNRYGTVNFGPDLEGIGNPGQWLEGTTGIGSYSIPLSVNYIRFPGPIKAGTANAGVTYTLNYD